MPPLFQSYEEFQQVDGGQLGRHLLGCVTTGIPNAAEFILDRNLPLRANKPALISRTYEGTRQVLTFADLLAGASRFAGVLDSLGVQPGGRVATLLEPIPDLYFAMLGAIRAGAVAQPLFPGFGCEAIADRLSDAGATVLITGARHLPTVRQALAQIGAPVRVLVVGEAELEAGEQAFAPLLALASSDRPATPVGGDAPLVLHYSSGTTGKPKGVVLPHEALVGQAATAAVVLDLQPEDVYWCTADPGWVTGTAYGLFGPWSLGITQVAYAGGFSAEAWYRTLQEERVTVWYTSPTALRMLMREGTEAARAFDLSALRHLCSVGEPLNAPVIEWGREAYGLTIHDTWWQTETGCIQIANYPFMPVRPGSMGRPCAGVQAAILDPASAEPLPPGQEGLLALRPPWPSMFRGYWQRPDLDAEKRRGEWYVTGDRATVDEDGYFWFVGRDDDVINTAGHLVGPFEVESALLKHPAVVEAAAFGIPDEGAGVAVAVQVVLGHGHTETRELARDLRTLVRRQVGAHAVPRVVEVREALPRTRSGKIMRRVARAQYLGLPTGDLSGLEGEVST